MQSAEWYISWSESTEVCLYELQVNPSFKGTPMYLVLSGHRLTFFLGAVKAKTSFFEIKKETLR